MIQGKGQGRGQREDVLISQNFDAGNIEVLTIDNPEDIQLRIRVDHQSEFYQWFYFCLTGAQGQTCTMKILNASGAAYPDGFKNYRVLYSYDQQEWLRHDTRLQDNVLQIHFTPEQDTVWFAYFVPFSMDRHRELVAGSVQSPRCSHRLIGQSLDGQNLDLLRISNGEANARKKNCWIMGRQHPGETMAEWWMEGCLEALLDENRTASNKLLNQCDLYLIPNMNPDGSRRGHLRTNAAGRNLNREWDDPSLEFSPEVFLTKQLMEEIGVDFFLDVHGDESLPYCFIAGTEGLDEWNEHKQTQLDFYKNTLANLNPDFQTREGYPPKPKGTANLTMSTAQTARNHSCLAMTLEMPFKDTTATPDSRYGWSVKRSKALAVSCLDALQLYLDSDLIE